MRTLSRAGLGATAFSWLAACAAPGKTEPAGTTTHETVTYVLRPEPAADRTRLAISMQFRGHGSGQTRIRLPEDRYGVPRMFDHVRELRVEGGSLVAGEGADRVVRHPPSADLTLHYEIDWDPTLHPDRAYRPAVSADHFHLFDGQWRVRVADGGAGAQRPRLRFADVPAGWSVLTNLDAERTDDEIEVLVAGARAPLAEFECAGTAVSVLVTGAFEDRAHVRSAVRAAVEMLAERFGPFGLDSYAICITGRPKYRAGVAIDNAFACFVDPDTGIDRLLLLVAHETLHHWIPGRAAVEEWRRKGEHGVDEYRLDWFIEGFVEYCTRVCLRAAGLIDEDALVAAFNRDLSELARNPMRHASLEEVAAALAAGDYTNHHERLNYTRGPLLALRWDRQLAAHGGPPLDRVVDAFIDAAEARGGTIGEADLFDLLERHGLAARADYERFVVRGEPLLPPADAFAPEFVRSPPQGGDGGGAPRFERR